MWGDVGRCSEATTCRRDLGRYRAATPCRRAPRVRRRCCASCSSRPPRGRPRATRPPRRRAACASIPRGCCGRCSDPTACTRDAHAMHTACTRHAHAMHTPCTWAQHAHGHSMCMGVACAWRALGMRCTCRCWRCTPSSGRASRRPPTAALLTPTSVCGVRAHAAASSGGSHRPLLHLRASSRPRARSRTRRARTKKTDSG